ncbi:DUF2252 family protein [Sphingomonas abietis]|uniref:DUF2252 family protein n=2 Tax=Sphingomonas abietis TaxID=3012344 RepID=A0ABY7NSH3_9SPHN|nr:DUF2252 family protein [Sphingomonas abietis]
MASSVHAYVRGNTGNFYRWLAEMPAARLVPPGPAIWICGDCHLGNLGPLADSERNIDFQIRDLDQTVIGNPALDLIRLGLSLETAARSSDLPGVTTARMLEAMIRGYGQAMHPHDDGEASPEPDVVRTVRKRASARGWRHLAMERIGDEEPSLPLGKRFWALSTEERHAITALFEDEEIRERALDLAKAGRKARLRVVDAAYWKKGCSSLGHLRFAVLLGIRRKGDRQEYLALVDIKEALPSVAPVAKSATMPSDPGERVVAGAMALSPNLGDRMIATHLLGRPVVLRELAPQDLKLEVGQFSRGEAVEAGAYLAYVVGRAHARQLDAAGRQALAECFGRDRAGKTEAPSWLWRTVVDLAGAHEIGYLEHCRRYARLS